MVRRCCALLPIDRGVPACCVLGVLVLRMLLLIVSPVTRLLFLVLYIDCATPSRLSDIAAALGPFLL